MLAASEGGWREAYDAPHVFSGCVLEASSGHDFWPGFDYQNGC